MKKKRVIGVFAVFLAVSVGGAQTLPSPSLKVGMSAPALSVEGFVQGEAVTEFKKGQVYVIELWATWCGPCKSAMPHLSKMAEEYKGKATFVGVAVMEKPKEGQTARGLVEGFVAKNLGLMTYPVAVDSASNDVAEKWMKASGMEGIPLTFVVDGAGKVAWIGRPGALESVLPGIVAGTYRAPAAAQSEQRISLAAIQAVNGPIKAAMEKKDYAGALSLIEAAEKKHPEMSRQLGRFRFQCFLASDVPAAKGMLEKELGGSRPTMGAVYGKLVAATQGLPGEVYDAGVKVLEAAVPNARRGEAAELYYSIQEIYALKGDRGQALVYAEKALESGRKDEVAEMRLQTFQFTVERLRAGESKLGGK